MGLLVGNRTDSAVRVAGILLPRRLFIGQLAKRLGHIEHPRFVVRIGDLLRKPYAFRRVAAVIDG